MIEVKFYDSVDDNLLDFAVIISKTNGKWVFCKHKERNTFEIPGGHREKGESIIDAAKRELREETGAVDFTIQPVCVYSVKGKTTINKTENEETFGMLYVADIFSFEEIHSEMEKIILSDKLIENWTYPLIQPRLMEEAAKRGYVSVIGKKDGFSIRLAKTEDMADYYEQNYCPLDKEAARLIGCKETFTKEEVFSFFQKSLEDKNRFFFLIIAPDGRIIGESVINEIDWELGCGNFRIGIFQKDVRGKGIGTWVTEMTRDFAFEQLKLHRLELDVYSFNPVGEKTYLKAGFKREGVLRDAVMDGEQYADDILMAMLEEDWKQRKAGR